MKTHHLLLLTCLVILFPSLHTQAQLAPPTPPLPVGATVPGYTEGPISAITLNRDQTATMTVLGTTVHVPGNALIESPTAQLSVRQLCSSEKLPNRSEPGFLGGTALVNGVVDVATGKFTATDMAVEPAENVLIGVVTSVSPLCILGTEVAFLNDPRIPFSAINLFGFEVYHDNIAVSDAVSAAGYFSNGKMNAFFLELPETARLINENSQINIRRGYSRERGPNIRRGDEVKLDGFYHEWHRELPIIRVFRVEATGDILIGSATAVADGVNPQFGVWRADLVTATSADPILGAAPTKLKLVMTDSQGFVVTELFDPEIIP
jgi:hypothetical protein